MSLEGEGKSGDGGRHKHQARLSMSFEFPVSSLVENYLMLFKTLNGYRSSDIAST